MAPSTQAYKGYLIRHNPIQGNWWVEKDGYFICYIRDADEARNIIDDQLTGYKGLIRHAAEAVEVFGEDQLEKFAEGRAERRRIVNRAITTRRELAMLLRRVEAETDEFARDQKENCISDELSYRLGIVAEELETPAPWSDQWPTEHGWYWFYGRRSRFADRDDLFPIQVRETSIMGSYVYISGGTLVYAEEGARGKWQKIDLPQNPGEV